MRHGRPIAEHPEEQQTLRLDPDIMAHFMADGPGWQPRIKAALRERIDRRTRAGEASSGMPFVTAIRGHAI